MKTRTKALLLTLCAALLVCATVLVTMAFLTDTATVTNTFTVGNVAITLDEAVVDEDGQATETRTETGNSYKLIPGKTYDKDPKVTVVADSEDCWLFVKLENGLSAIIADEAAIETQMTDIGWALIDPTNNIYAYKDKVAAETTINVFNSFTLTDDAKVENYKTAEIVVTAYAVQADGFDTAEEAWNATFGASSASN